MLDALPKIDCPRFHDVEFPSSSSASSSSRMDLDLEPQPQPLKDDHGYSQPFGKTKRRLEQIAELEAQYPGSYDSLVSPGTGAKAGVTPRLAGGIRVLPPGPVPVSPSKSKITTPGGDSRGTSRNVTPASRGTSRNVTPASRGTSRTMSPASRGTTNSRPSTKIFTPPVSTPPKSPKRTRSPYPVTTPQDGTSPALECHISVDDRPELPIKARMPKNIEGGKWLNHRPVVNLDEVNLLKPCLEKKKTVTIPDVDDFDETTNRYLLQHQEQDSCGEIRTQFIKGDVKISRGGGRCVEFTDIETASVKPSAKGVYNKGLNVYPPPQIESGDWTDTETRCRVGVGIPTAKTRPWPAPQSR